MRAFAPRFPGDFASENRGANAGGILATGDPRSYETLATACVKDLFEFYSSSKLIELIALMH